jgi:gluconokinase
VLSIDIGTSSLRVMLFDSSGRAVEGVGAQAPYEMRTTSDGGVEADADEMLDSLFRCIDDALGRAGQVASRIVGVATTTLVSNVLGVGYDGRAMTPVYTYADTRNAREVDLLRSRLDEAWFHDRTGCPIHTSYLPARFLWLKSARPDLFSRIKRWMSVGEYLLLCLFGQTRCSLSVASWTGLLDRRRLAWDEAILNQLPISSDQLSPLGDLDQPLSGLKGEYAHRWPSLSDVPWFPAVGDGAASNVGSGCTSAERIAINVGTSGAMRVVTEEDIPRVPPGLWLYRVDGRRPLLGGALTDGGSIFAWLRDALRLGDPAEIESELSRMDADAHGLTFLPFLAGERSPGWAAEARCSIIGISLYTRPINILRAGLEAVAYRFALIHELLSPAVSGGGQIIASGGALLRSPVWLQIISDVLGRAVVASGENEATSRGAALLALEALGLLRHLEDAPASMGKVYRPDPARYEKYRQAIERQRHLYDLLIKKKLSVISGQPSAKKFQV